MARIIIASGGTGGHSYPGFSLGTGLRKRGHEVLYLVRRDDPSLPLLESHDFPALPLDLHGMPRRPGPALLAFSWRLSASLIRLWRAYKAYRPQMVVGMGAYLSFPAVLAAWTQRVPALIHESNVVLGLANRLSLPFSRRVCLGLPHPDAGLAGLGTETLVTGTPIRESLWEPMEAAGVRLALGLEREKRTVLVVGGSQGARSLNAVLPGALSSASGSGGAGFQVLHLAGAKDRDVVEKEYARKGMRAVVLDYLERMDLAYGAADLVICRSGASTLAELIALRKPAILVPYPHASAGHQSANARFLEAAGCAERVEESDLTEEAVKARVADMLGPEGAQRLKDMRGAFERLSVPVGRAAQEALIKAVEGLLKGT